MQRFATLRDVIEQAIKPALAPYENDYYLEVIAAATYEWRVDTDQNGNELLTSAGFQPRGDIDFWAVAEKCRIKG